MFITEGNIPKVMAYSPRGQYKDIRLGYDRIVREAEGTINEIPVFSFGLFEDKFFNRAASWDNLFSAMIEHIQVLKLESRFGYAASFESTLRAVKEFHKGEKLDFNSRDKVETRYKEYLSGKKLSFPDITSTWLKKFDAWQRDQGKSRSTTGIYMRNIRVLFNLALKKHGVKAEYPFYDYHPNQADDRKMALSASRMALMANYKTENPQEQFYRDVFIFSFLANGMNLSDIAKIKYSDIAGGEISFVREKTKRKNKNKIYVPITTRMQSIIDRHGNKAIGHDAFVFPILRPEWNDQKQFASIKELVKKVNSNIKHIAVKVGITERISSYTARHSFSTILKNSGTRVEFLKEALGHSSIRVTEKYLKSFESDTRREHSERLEEQVFLKHSMDGV